MKILDSKIFSTKDELIIDQCSSKLLGKHNLYNMAAAILISKIFKINNEIISSSLEKFEPLEHRMEKLKSNSKVTFINDSKGTNIFSTISAIESFSNNIILILGGYSEEKINKNIIIKTINKKKIIYIICYGSVGIELASIIKKVKPSIYYKTFNQAVIHSINIAKEKDVVLLSPAFKSFDQFNNYQERGDKFKKIVKKFYA